MSLFSSSFTQLRQEDLVGALKRQLGLASAAWFLALYDDQSLWDPSTRLALEEAVNAHASAHFTTSNATAPKKNRKDSRFSEIERMKAEKGVKPVRLFTDLDSFEESIPEMQLPSGISIVSDSSDADFLFVCAHIRNFLEIPIYQRVSQFPYEGCLVRKDLLPMTIRSYCYSKDGAAPVWWLPCYDLSTQFHLFAFDYNQRLRASQQSSSSSSSPSNRWIIKPAQGTRGKGHQLLTNQDRSGLVRAAACAPFVLQSDLPSPLPATVQSDFASDVGDRVVQLLVDHPLLMRRRKFDIRCFVFVRSFEPFVAYTPVLHYARLANKPYSLETLDDYQVALTVTAYDDDVTIAEQQQRCFHTAFSAALAEQYGDGVIDTAGMWERTLQLLREVFGVGGASEIGCWPNSSAYYSVDVIYDASELNAQQEPTVGFVPQPKLIEINYMGDWHGVSNAVEGDTATYHDWIRDLLSVVVQVDQVSEETLDSNPRLHRL